jgi:hypothetical protein
LYVGEEADAGLGGALSRLFVCMEIATDASTSGSSATLRVS